MLRDDVLIKWNKSNINHQSRFKLEFNCHRPNPESRKFPSRIRFSELSKLQDYSMEIVESENFSRLIISVSLRPRLFETANVQMFQERDFHKTIIIYCFSRLRFSETHQRLSSSLLF